MDIGIGIMRGVRSVAIILLLGAAVNADVPRFLHYQGKLRNAGGALVNATASFQFRMWNHPTAGGIRFDETHPGIEVANGLFSVLIGSLSGGVPDSALDAEAVYLGISVDGGPELAPRIRLSSTPHAIKARSAEQLVVPGTFSPAAVVESSGKIAIGTSGPAQTQLDVGGGIRVADHSAPCTAALAGTIRWNGQRFQGCNGARWMYLDHILPLISQISPDTGPDAGGTAITVTGSNFQALATVNLGGIAATDIVVVSSTQITAVTPAHAEGAVDVEVVNPDGDSFTQPAGFTYAELPNGTTQERAAPSCKLIIDNGYSTGDGLYWIDPNGGDTNDAFQAYCDMTTDGGGWTLVVRITNDCLHVNSGSVGQLSSPSQAAGGKLSDVAINQLHTQFYRLTCGAYTDYFNDPGKAFNATSPGGAGTIYRSSNTYTSGDWCIPPFDGNPHGGVTSYSDGASCHDALIYNRTDCEQRSENGCYDGHGLWDSSGTVFVK